MDQTRRCPWSRCTQGFPSISTRGATFSPVSVAAAHRQPESWTGLGASRETSARRRAGSRGLAQAATTHAAASESDRPFAGCGRSAKIRMLRPWRAHVVRRPDEVGLHADDHAVADLEGLQEAPRLGLLVHRSNGGAVRQLVLVEHTLVVDEATRHHDAALFIDQEEVAIADSLVEEVPAGFESLLDVWKFQAVLIARRVRGEARVADRSVVLLQGREVAVRQGYQLCAGSALLGRNDRREIGVVVLLVNIAYRGRRSTQVALGREDVLDLDDLAAFDLQADRQKALSLPLQDRGVDAYVAGLGVREGQRRADLLSHRVPAAVGKLQHLDVVLGEADVLGDGSSGRVVLEVGVPVLVCDVLEAGAVTGSRCGR